MSNGRESVDEELIRDAGQLPRVSPELRDRVLKTVRQTHRRRQLVREAIGAAMFLALAALAGRWYGDVLLPGPPLAGRDRTPLHAGAETEPDLPLSNRALPAGAAAGGRANRGDWEEVDAASQSREQKSRVLQATF